MKKILFISGNARSLIANRGDLIRAMQAEGHVVSAAVPAEDMLDSVYDLGIEIYPFKLGRTGLNPLQDLKTLFFLYRLMRRVRPDMTFAYTIKPVIWGSLAARLAGVKGRFSMITGLGAGFGVPKNFKAKLLRRLVTGLYGLGASSSTKLFFQNPDDMNDFIELGILKDNSKAVRTMGSGVNLALFPRVPIDNGVFTFVFIARLLRDKGIYQFVEAASVLKPQFQNARFIAVGPHDPGLPSAVSIEDLNEWKRKGDVEFIGGVKDVKPWLALSSVFVLPSFYREGTPRSALEAMATGRAVITSDSPGCRETVVDGVNGFLVKPQSVASLVFAMKTFLEQPDLAVSMGEASYQRVVADYDVNSVNDVILKAMELK